MLLHCALIHSGCEPAVDGRAHVFGHANSGPTTSTTGKNNPLPHHLLTKPPPSSFPPPPTPSPHYEHP
jgi:hypothetical protein